MKKPPIQMCEEHDEVMKIYCFDCSRLICRDCRDIDHAGHEYEFVKKSAPEIRKKLTEQLNPLKELKKNLSHALDNIESTKYEIKAQGNNAVTNNINKSFDELVRIIENHRQELLKEAALKVTEKLEHLSAQEKSLSMTSTGIQSVVEYIELCVEDSTNDEILCMHAEIKTYIEKNIKEHWKEMKSLEPVEEVDIGVEVNCSEDLRKLCQTQAKLTIDPAKFGVSGEQMRTAEIGGVYGFSLTLNLKHARLDCHSKSLVNGTIVRCTIDQNEGKEYHVSCTPTIRGRHELTVTMNGQEVAGSPFPVFVSIHPNKLQKPVKIIPGLKNLTGVAINSLGEIILSAVTESGGDVVVLDKEGKIRKINYEFRHPSNVAIDSEDNIFYVDYEDSNLLKFNSNLKIVIKKRTKQINPGYAGLALFGDEVVVSERHNNCTLEVFNTKLEYVRKIVSPIGGRGNFDRVAVDNYGNLYVGVHDETNPRIEVLTNGGEFLRLIGFDGNGVNLLSYPIGLCVANQYVYVADHDYHNISIFTTDGKYVTSFGRPGHDKGELRFPHGVFMDRDGFIHICDRGNERLHIF